MPRPDLCRTAEINTLIQQLIRSGNRLHPDLLADILACGEAAVDPLIAIIGDPEMYWDDVRNQPRWLPEYAMGMIQNAPDSVFYRRPRVG
jgi:hypothetical protein